MMLGQKLSNSSTAMNWMVVPSTSTKRVRAMKAAAAAVAAASIAVAAAVVAVAAVVAAATAAIAAAAAVVAAVVIIANPDGKPHHKQFVKKAEAIRPFLFFLNPFCELST